MFQSLRSFHRFLPEAGCGFAAAFSSEPRFALSAREARTDHRVLSTPLPQIKISSKATYFYLAERQGFGPWVQLPGQRLSRSPHSTTLPPLRGSKYLFARCIFTALLAPHSHRNPVLIGGFLLKRFQLL